MLLGAARQNLHRLQLHPDSDGPLCRQLPRHSGGDGNTPGTHRLHRRIWEPCGRRLSGGPARHLSDPVLDRIQNGPSRQIPGEDYYHTMMITILRSLLYYDDYYTTIIAILRSLLYYDNYYTTIKTMLR